MNKVAWQIDSGSDEGEGVVLFATDADAARKAGADHFDCSPEEIDDVIRTPEFDEFGTGKKVTARALIASGWWLTCHHCGARMKADEDDEEDTATDLDPAGYQYEAYCNPSHQAMAWAALRMKQAREHACIEAALLEFPGITDVRAQGCSQWHMERGDIPTATFRFPGQDPKTYGRAVEWVPGDDTVSICKVDLDAWAQYKATL